MKLFKIIVICAIMLSVLGCVQESDDKTIQAMALSRSATLSAEQNKQPYVEKTRKITLRVELDKSLDPELSDEDYKRKYLGYYNILDIKVGNLRDDYEIQYKEHEDTHFCLSHTYLTWNYALYLGNFSIDKESRDFTNLENLCVTVDLSDSRVDWTWRDYRIFKLKDDTSKVVVKIRSITDITYEEF